MLGETLILLVLLGTPYVPGWQAEVLSYQAISADNDTKTDNPNTAQETNKRLTIPAREASAQTERKPGNGHSDAKDDEYWLIWGHHLKITDTLLVIFTALLSAVTCGLVWITGRQIRQARILERAYVSGGGFFPAMDGSTFLKSHEFLLTVDNYGKTPARVDRVRIGFWRLTAGNLPDDPRWSAIYQLGMVVGPGEKGMPTEIKLARATIDGEIIFGRFFYRDIFFRRLIGRRPRVRHSTFILRITGDRTVLPVRDHPPAYDEWT